MISSKNAATSSARSNMSAGYLADKLINITELYPISFLKMLAKVYSLYSKISGCRCVQFSQMDKHTFLINVKFINK